MRILQHYALHDTGRHSGMIPIPRELAREMNDDGYGIFTTIQVFDTAVRRLDNLKAIRVVAVDLDCSNGETKASLAERIKKSPIEPSYIVETKNGYHVYFELRHWIYSTNSEKLSKIYSMFMKSRVIPFFNADKQCSDATRTLRIPGYFHMKDPENPFLVKKVHESGKRYSFSDIKKAFPKTVDYAIRKRKILHPLPEFEIVKLLELSGIKISHVKQSIIMAHCPLSGHSKGDRTASLAIYPKTNSFYCFGCGKGGSSILFYKNYFRDIPIQDTIVAIKNLLGANNG